jgi:methylenetetrahydrofolate--tRNA-(uracil-5-)-methyltransferase
MHPSVPGTPSIRTITPVTLTSPITIVGGGLAGTEAAWQIARRGVPVRLHEMRPVRRTPAHSTDKLAELVCSNSFGADDITKAPGLLKHEMRRLGSLLIECAAEATVPAGAALAVDRDVFADAVTSRIQSHPLIEVVRNEVTEIPAGVTIIASGPLTSDTLAADIARRSGSQHLYFWDAIAPIVTHESVDFSIAFRASRYGKDAATAEGEPEAQGDYINCPMSKDEYYAFIDALIAAETAALREFELAEKDHFFEGCLPVEVLARRGRDALAYGPMRPVGIRDPRTNKRPYAVVQLRQDNVAGTLYNLVGFQTNLKFGEQDRVLRMIPGLTTAEFVRYGVMHRNTFINSPTLLHPTLRFRASADTAGADPLFFAGQIVGVEGYAGNAATGLLAGINAVEALHGRPEITLPPTTMLGALCHYVTHCEPKHFQPMKAAFGLFPALENPPRDKRVRAELYSERARAALEQAIAEHPALTA